MFIELEPLLADRTLVLTVSRIDRHAIRVNVIPKARRENDEAEKAIATPLSITGSAAELDRELAVQLAGYTEAILQTGSTLQQVQEVHKAALKEIEAENKKALDAKRKISGAKAPPKAEDNVAPAKDGQPVSEAKPRPPAAVTTSLFDDPSPADSVNLSCSPIANREDARDNASKRDIAAGA
ncbi:MAG: PRTRC system protein E [Bryobacteraceae bacterium]